METSGLSSTPLGDASNRESSNTKANTPSDSDDSTTQANNEIHVRPELPPTGEISAVSDTGNLSTTHSTAICNGVAIDDAPSEIERTRLHRTPLTKPRTMQEFVETFYMPPTRISIANRQLPTLTEKSHRLVESILNYRHVLGSREKSEQHKSR